MTGHKHTNGASSSEAPSRVAIYARVSTTDQNCEMQVRELREYAVRRGWNVSSEYVDTGWSGAKVSRPELDRLMRDAALRRFDAVLVWKLDRFGRSLRHCLDGIRPEVEKVHNMRDASACDEAQPGQVCVVPHLAAVDHLLELNGERH
jgi:predicted site-specific integrase-resolvase